MSYLQLAPCTHLHLPAPSTPGPLPLCLSPPLALAASPERPVSLHQGLQLADEFIRPRALPRSIAVFGPNREGIRGPLVAIGHRPWSLEVGQKSPRMSHMSMFGLGVRSWSRRLLFCTLAIWLGTCLSLKLQREEREALWFEGIHGNNEGNRFLIIPTGRSDIWPHT